jgi:peptidoglycan/LPS O-acetylase OafA/YrhL
VWLQLGCAAVLSAVAGAAIEEFDGSKWMFMARYLVFFLLGCHARQMIERVARSSRPLTVVTAAGLCVGGAAGAVALDIRSVPGIALALNVLAVAFGVLLAAWISRHRIGRPLVGLGSRTLPVYLIHIYWLAVVTAAVRYIDVPLPAQYALPVVLTIGVTALSLLTHRLLLRAGAPWMFALPSHLAYRPPAAERRTTAPLSTAAATGRPAQA